MSVLKKVINENMLKFVEFVENIEKTIENLKRACNFEGGSSSVLCRHKAIRKAIHTAENGLY